MAGGKGKTLEAEVMLPRAPAETGAAGGEQESTGLGERQGKILSVSSIVIINL